MELEVESRLGFAETIERLIVAATESKMTVLAVHAMSETLASKGFPREPITLIEVCNARMASQALEDDIRVALMMPCPIAVYEAGGKVHASTMDTRILSQMYEGQRLPSLGEEMLAVLRGVLATVEPTP